jgi:hypothetical protein
MNAGYGIRDLSRDEFASAQRRFMVEQDATAGKDAVRFAIIYRNPVAEQLGDRIRAARIERRFLILRRGTDATVELRSRRLIELDLFVEMADCLE